MPSVLASSSAMANILAFVSTQPERYEPLWLFSIVIDMLAGPINGDRAFPSEVYQPNVEHERCPGGWF